MGELWDSLAGDGGRVPTPASDVRGDLGSVHTVKDRPSPPLLHLTDTENIFCQMWCNLIHQNVLVYAWDDHLLVILFFFVYTWSYHDIFFNLSNKNKIYYQFFFFNCIKEKYNHWVRLYLTFTNNLAPQLIFIFNFLSWQSLLIYKTSFKWKLIKINETWRIFGFQMNVL